MIPPNLHNHASGVAAGFDASIPKCLRSQGNLVRKVNISNN